MAEAATERGALGEAVAFLDHSRNLPDPNQAGKAPYPHDEDPAVVSARGAGALLPDLLGLAGEPASPSGIGLTAIDGAASTWRRTRASVLATRRPTRMCHDPTRCRAYGNTENP